jgi:hypothetical protein
MTAWAPEATLRWIGTATPSSSSGGDIHGWRTNGRIGGAGGGLNVYNQRFHHGVPAG